MAEATLLQDLLKDCLCEKFFSPQEGRREQNGPKPASCQPHLDFS